MNFIVENCKIRYSIHKYLVLYMKYNYEIIILALGGYMLVEDKFEQIDNIKTKGVKRHCISTCKGKIDEVYLYFETINVDNLEMILYDRKTNLRLEQKWNSEVKMSFILTAIGAFFGIYASYIVTNFANLILRVFNIRILKMDPMKIIYSKDTIIFFIVHLFLLVIIAIGTTNLFKRSENKVDRQFYEDMSNYELEKIEKQFDKLKISN